MIDKAVHSEIVRRSMTDPDFRERLLAYPSSTIAEVTGIDVPEDFEVVVVENGQGKAHIVLPHEGELDALSADVSSEELDDTRGGHLLHSENPFRRGEPGIRPGGWQPPRDLE